MQNDVVKTTLGRIRGQRADGILRFLGVPYAAPPVGARRFEVPEPPEPWTGVRDALELGPTAPHPGKTFPGLDIAPLIGTGWRRGDDYLNVNVWMPERAEGDPLRPVMVFVHGGGFVLGSNYADVQDGTAFAQSGIVCIAANYRLGVEGFLPIPGVPTNLGLRDILFALQWVKENAATFGGDPDNVTVFGESAGAMAIADLVASPLAKGLFRRAIIQSGHGAMVRSIPVARRLVRKVARLLRVTPDAAGFRSASPEACVAALEKASLPTTRINLRDEEGRDPVFGISRFVPVYGDDVLPEKPHDALAKGAGQDVDVLIGSNAEEMNLYLVPTGVRDRIGRLLATFLLSRSQPGARAVLRDYGIGAPGRKPGQALTDALHDLVFRWPARRFAEAHQGRTHFYELDWRSPAFGGELGACHGLDLGFVFKTLPSVTGPEGLAGTAPPQGLADHMHGLWVRYATDGHLPWREYEPATRLVYGPWRDEAEHEPPMPAARHLP